MSTETTREAGTLQVTRSDLEAALTEFYLAVRDYRGYQEGGQVAGQVAHPDAVADALYATLSRMAAERRPDSGVKPCGCDSSRRCLDCATDNEVLASIPDFPS